MSQEDESLSMTCSECEAVLGDYRDGTLETGAAAMVRRHLLRCASCAELSAAIAAVEEALGAMPKLAPPERLVTAILAQTLPSRGPHPWTAWAGLGKPMRWWKVASSPRLLLGVAMSVFAVALALNAAQVNLQRAFRNFSPEQLAPKQLAASAKRQWNRSLALGADYYRDLRVVYEIEAVVQALRQAPPPADAPNRTQTAQPRPGETAALTGPATRLGTWSAAGFVRDGRNGAIE